MRHLSALGSRNAEKLFESFKRFEAGTGPRTLIKSLLISLSCPDLVGNRGAFFGNLAKVVFRIIFGGGGQADYEEFLPMCLSGI
jgi:hypothetical protein